MLITTSWDDGHPLDLRVADLLARYGLAGTFYVPLQAERPVLDARQIRMLSAGFEIGAHTVHHTPLPGLPLEGARAECRYSRERLEWITGRRCEIFCFPRGQFRRAHLGVLREAGFVAARTVELLSIERPAVVDGVCLIPTTVQVFSHSAPALLRNSLRRFQVAHAAQWLLHCRRLEWGALAERLLALARARGGVFHLWGHSWEIEERGQWGRLEEMFRLLVGERGRAGYRTNLELCREGG